MSTLHFYLFGSMHMLVEDDPTDIRLPRGVQELFAYLLLEQNRTHSREILAGKLWGSFTQDRARYWRFSLK